jgi:DNA polymerase-3 subunit delta'
MILTQFEQLIGNELAKSYLQRMLENNRVGHSLLFAGPDGIGKSLYAHVFAAQLMMREDPQGSHRHKIEKGNHPDIHVYRPEGKLGLHSIHSLRQFAEEVYLPPYEAAWKVFIIHDADRMLSYSANALLKTFEEPPPQTLIILLSSSPLALLPTILSRCRIVRFNPLSEQEIRLFLNQRYGDQWEESLTRLARGSLARAIHLKESQGDTIRQTLLHILSRGSFATYRELVDAVQQVAEYVESSKKQVEEAAKAELYKIATEQLSAHQQHFLEKELEGVVSLNYLQSAHDLLEVILSWYRDLHLLCTGGVAAHLYNPEWEEALRDHLELGNLLDIEEVGNAVQDAQTALQRSTSLNIVLEHLFLKLQ